MGVFQNIINHFLGVKTGRDTIEGKGEGGGRHCFLLIWYGFCTCDALYSASLSFRMCIFLLTPFGT